MSNNLAVSKSDDNGYNHQKAKAFFEAERPKPFWLWDFPNICKQKYAYLVEINLTNMTLEL